MFLIQRLSGLSILSNKTLKSLNQSAFFCSATNLIDQQVLAGVPSLTWNANALHGLNKEQIEFRANVRNFAEKELPAELVGKVKFILFDYFFVQFFVFYI